MKRKFRPGVSWLPIRSLPENRVLRSRRAKGALPTVTGPAKKDGAT